MKNKVAAVSAAIYTLAALALAGAFVGAATFAGRYTWLERGRAPPGSSAGYDYLHTGRDAAGTETARRLGNGLGSS